MELSLPAVKLLSQEVIHRIAAGEVVDRPASALKELLENSIDAGAKNLKVTIVDGGIQQIIVEDDGFGMTAKDLEISIQRHATSKISSLEDLEALYSLGFRGEALSAISSVSRLKIETTRAPGPGWILEVSGGVKAALKPSARAKGTKVTIENLFFNVPARRKFLKRPATEAQECADILESMALAHPEVGFEWYVVDNSGEVKKQKLLPIQSPKERFENLAGVQARLVEVQKTTSLPVGINEIHLLAMAPPAAAKNQKSISLVVNGRVVFDKRLPYALREAYAGLIEIGYFPVVSVRMQVDPSLVDVNIHPQKKEIRWPTEINIASLVYQTLRPAFEVQQKPQAVYAETSSAPLFESSAPRAISAAYETQAESFIPEFPTASFPIPTMAAKPFSVSISQDIQPPFAFKDLRVVGEVGAAWIICESEQGLVVIDQHAAAERVEFEKILQCPDLLHSKPLLIPMDLEIPLGLQGQEVELTEILESLKFEVSDLPTKKGVLEILAVPQTSRRLDLQDIFEDIFSELEDKEWSQNTKEHLRHKLSASMACHGSVRRGQRLANDEIKALMQSLSEIQWGGFCPHGRPIWFLMEHTKIEGLFHR